MSFFATHFRGVNLHRQQGVTFYVFSNRDLKTLQAFFTDELVQADLKGCYNECTTCMTKLGTQADFTAKMTALFAKLKAEKYAGYNFNENAADVQNWIAQTYNTLYQNCVALAQNCVAPSPCDQKLEVMKMDARPGGQYALYDYNGTTGTYTYTERSINLLRFYNDPTAAEIYNLYYKDEAGNDIYPHNLSESEFIRQYINHPEWADAFVKKHIEYCSYQWCKDQSYSSSSFNNEASYRFDATLQENISSGLDAVNRNYFSQSDYTLLLNADPFFNGGRGSLYKDAMRNGLTRLSEVLQIKPKDLAGNPLPVKNILEVIDWMLYCKPASENPSQTDLINSWYCAQSPGCRSLTSEWELFRNYYLQLKGKYMALVKKTNVPDCVDCFVGSDGVNGNCAGGAGEDIPSTEDCPDASEFYIERQTTGEGTGYYQEDVYFVSSRGPLNKNVVVAVTYEEKGLSDPYNPCGSAIVTHSTYNNQVTLIAGEDRVLIGTRNISYTTDYWGCYDYYYEEDYTAVFSHCESGLNECQSLCKGSSDVSYGTYGSKVYNTGFAADGTGTVQSTLNTSSLWKNTCNTCGPLIRSALWPCNIGEQITGWLTIDRQVTFPRDGWYYVGISGDNYVRFGVDGNIMISTTNALTFQYWHIYPVYFTKGTHVISIGGKNDGGPRAFGCEIYDNTLSQLAAATSLDPNQITILFSTSGQVNTTINCPAPLTPSLCKDDPRYNDYKNKTRVWDEYANIQGYLSCAATANTPAISATDAAANLKVQVEQNLDAQKELWKSQLRAVRDEEAVFSSIYDDQINNLADQLYIVAKKNIDLAYNNYLSSPTSENLQKIRPASQLPSGQSAANGHNNFMQVFTSVIGSSLIRQGFGPDLLEQPYPFDKTPFDANTNSLDLGAATRANITLIRNRFTATGGSGDAQFHAYLKEQLGDDYTLTVAQLSDLWSRVTNNCNVLNEPLKLPVAFTSPVPANPYHPSVNCATVASLRSTFTTVYPFVTEDTKLYRVLLTGYLNHNLGYALTYGDYDNFKINRCAANPAALLYNQPVSLAVPEDQFACVTGIMADIFNRAGQEYEAYITEKRRLFRNAYISKCLSAKAAAQIEGDLYEYHYTLYYYDQSGNLVKTIPPEGVKLLSDADVQAIANYRNAALQCSGASIPTAENAQGTFTALGTGLANNTVHSTEMWWYSDNKDADRQVRFITPDQKYMYQATIAGKKLYADIYSLKPQNGEVVVTGTNRAVADISNIQTENWSHLTIQSSGRMAASGPSTTTINNTALAVNNGYVTSNLNNSVSNNFTVEFWAYPYGPTVIDNQSTSGYAGTNAGRNYAIFPAHGVVSTTAGMGITVGTNGVCVYEHTVDYIPALLSWSGTLGSSWHHIAVVYSNKQPKLYVDGTLVKTGLTSPKTYVRPSTGILGGPYGVMQGQIDEVRVWNYARSQTELQNNKNIALTGSESGLINYWPINKEDGTAVLPDKKNSSPITLPGGYTSSNWVTGVASGTYMQRTITIPPTPGDPLVLYLDGQRLTNITANPPANPFPWQTTGAYGGYVVPANDLGTLKHFRIYSRAASDGEVAANAANTCLAPVGPLAVQNNPLTFWGRFNIPQPGTETTVGAESTVEQARRYIVPKHNLPTNYVFNSFNSVTRQATPDAGVSQFWYDRLGRLAISQNAKQAVTRNGSEQAYSYTRYDALGRITEVGEKATSVVPSEAMIRHLSGELYWQNGGTNSQVTVTAYDEAPAWAPVSLAGTQYNLRKRVAATALLTSGSNPAANRTAASYYSYDISGNVDRLVQEQVGLSTAEGQYVSGSTGLKELKYDYDLISGKVNKVSYQKGKWDQFFYSYVYDDDNRLTDAYSSRVDYNTSTQLTNWVREAHYRYYLHGPLARMELGKNNVQGLDYAYTLQGWLKGVNSSVLEATKDMSGDGHAASPFASYGRDVFGFSLEYFGGDYRAIGSGANAFSLSYTHPSPGTLTSRNFSSGKSLFNGNISAASYAIKGIEGDATAGYSYRYDQLNRLTAMNRHTIGAGSAVWDNGSIIDAYKESISYDANGNIKTYRRNGPGASAGQWNMDDLTYHYNLDGEGRLVNNKLRHVTDAATSGFTEDLKSQGVDNYRYDAVGNLVADLKADIGDPYTDGITWTVYGKIGSISKTDGTLITYSYDAAGNRISKAVSKGGITNTTYYIRDGQGNTMGVYTLKSGAGSGNGFSWSEQHLYGSSRLGMLTPNYFIASGQPLGSSSYNSGSDPAHNGMEGLRRYELSNHLGNVLATITDRKIGRDGNSDGIIDYFEADVVSAQDYYPFGMQMPGRTMASGTYRYGFNGKEKSDEILGEGNIYDYGFRIYNPRLGRFLSVDPLCKSFPWWTPYQFAGNTPIQAVDLDGLEILLPRLLPIPVEPILTIPKAPTIPVPTLPGEIIIPPLAPMLPPDLTIGQPKLNTSNSKPVGIDWENSPPSSPGDLSDTWEETTHPENKSGSMDFKNKETGEQLRWDPAKEGANGWEGKNHWHRLNPNSKNKMDQYLDKSGNPTPRGSGPSHIEAPKVITLPEVIIKREPDNRNFFQKAWDKVKDFFTPAPSKPTENPYYL